MVAGEQKKKKGYSNPSSMKPQCHSYLLPFIRRRLVRCMVSIKKSGTYMPNCTSSKIGSGCHFLGWVSMLRKLPEATMQTHGRVRL